MGLAIRTWQARRSPSPKREGTIEFEPSKPIRPRLSLTCTGEQPLRQTLQEQWRANVCICLMILRHSQRLCLGLGSGYYAWRSSGWHACVVQLFMRWRPLHGNSRQAIPTCLSTYSPQQLLVLYGEDFLLLLVFPQMSFGAATALIGSSNECHRSVPSFTLSGDTAKVPAQNQKLSDHPLSGPAANVALSQVRVPADIPAKFTRFEKAQSNRSF